MGNWKYRIAGIAADGRGISDPTEDRDAIDLLFCFSQVGEENEDWKDLTAKADQFMREDGKIKEGSAARIERLLNAWATGKNSPLRSDRVTDPNVLRFSAPAYLFNGYNAMKQYFASIGVNLEENLPKLKPEAKECAEKVAAAAASTESIEIPSAKEEKQALRKYISDQYQRAYYYGMKQRAEIKPVNPYLNEKGPVKVLLDRMDESSRKEIRTISGAYEGIKDSKKWYGKDDEIYTDMMTAVREYTEAQKQRNGSAISEDEKAKLETAMRACSRYVEEKDGKKFTSVGAKRLDAAKEMLELMNGLPEARPVRRKMAQEKAVKEATERRMKEKAAEEKAAEKRQEEKKAAKKTEKQAQKKPAAAKPANKKPAGPADKGEEWFQMTAAVMRLEKDISESWGVKRGDIKQDFERMNRVMQQYKSMTAKDQARVHDMWVNQFEMGEDTWKMLKERNGIKEKVATNFQDLNKAEQKEKPKMSKNSQSVVKEAEKEPLQKNKGSKSL